MKGSLSASICNPRSLTMEIRDEGLGGTQMVFGYSNYQEPPSGKAMALPGLLHREDHS